MTVAISADHIAGGMYAGGEYEPQRKNNWVLRASPPSIRSISFRTLELVIHSFDFPKVETEVVAVKAGNRTIWYPIASKVLSMSLVITNYSSSKHAEILWDWNQMVYNLETGLPLFSRDVYAIRGSLFLLRPNGDIAKKWTLHSLWPSKVDLGSGDMNAAEVNRVSAVMQCDSIESLS